MVVRVRVRMMVSVQFGVRLARFRRWEKQFSKKYPRELTAQILTAFKYLTAN